MSETPVFTLRGGWNTLFIFEHGVEIRSMGLVGSNVQHIRYDQIAQVAIKRGVFSSLIIESRGGHTLTVKRVIYPRAEEARAMIQDRMIRTLDVTSEGVSSSAPSLATLIRELSELKEAGIISEAEFESKKTELLDRM
jgi:Short C-terminal domain